MYYFSGVLRLFIFNQIFLVFKNISSYWSFVHQHKWIQTSSSFFFMTNSIWLCPYATTSCIKSWTSCVVGISKPTVCWRILTNNLLSLTFFNCHSILTVRLIPRIFLVYDEIVIFFSLVIILLQTTLRLLLWNHTWSTLFISWGVHSIDSKSRSCFFSLMSWPSIWSTFLAFFLWIKFS